MDAPRQPTRREMIKWMFTAAAASSLLGRSALGGTRVPVGKGYGADPDLIRNYQAGDLWPLTLNDSERAKAAMLCGMILPAEGSSPGADQLHVHDFIDEWVSAPYPGQENDRGQMLAGLAWLDLEAQRRFKVDFIYADIVQRGAICDDICHTSDERAEFSAARLFFRRFRDLTAAGYFTTPEGMKDIQYTGNVAGTSFEGPPMDLLTQLGLI